MTVWCKHSWAYVEASLIRELARALAGEILRPRRELVARVCSVCGGTPCPGRVSTRQGLYGCDLVAGHEGPCDHPDIKPYERYGPPTPPQAPPSAPPPAPAPAPVPVPPQPPDDAAAVALEVPA